MSKFEEAQAEVDRRELEAAPEAARPYLSRLQELRGQVVKWITRKNRLDLAIKDSESAALGGNRTGGNALSDVQARMRSDLEEAEKAVERIREELQAADSQYRSALMAAELIHVPESKRTQALQLIEQRERAKQEAWREVDDEWRALMLLEHHKRKEDAVRKAAQPFDSALEALRHED